MSRGVLLGLLASVPGCTCAHAGASEPAPIAELSALRTPTPPRIDGKLDEPAWRDATPSGQFVDPLTGRFVPPESEVRALWDADSLYLGLYAADEDLRSDDHMTVILEPERGRRLTFEVNPAGKLSSTAPAGLRAAAEQDGTIDQPRDDDEEWTVELQVPWRSLGLAGPTPIGIGFGRRDQPKGSAARESVWGQRGAALGVIRLR